MGALESTWRPLNKEASARGDRMKPLRVISLVLAFIAALELWAILSLPTYEKELKTAKQAYYEALQENVALKNELRRAFK